MRTKNVLIDDFEDIKIFYQYLYLDPDHRITFSNGLTGLIIRMDDNLNILIKNKKFPDVPEMNIDSLAPNNILAIIDLLKEKPAIEYPEGILKNRWEEIKEITMANLSLNKAFRR